MRLSEHEAKAVFRQAGLATPEGVVIEPGRETDMVPPFPAPWYLKSQVLAGGRGKAGAIKRVDRQEDLAGDAARLFALPVAGRRPPYLRLEPDMRVMREMYMSLAVSRTRQAVTLTAGRFGGMDVETADPADLVHFDLPPPFTPTPRLIRTAFFHLGLNPALFPAFTEVVTGLCDAFERFGLILAEINPLALTAAGRLVALDAKAEIDDTVLAARPDLAARRDVRFETPAETTAREAGFGYVGLTGRIGVMANGAGLAMATMDSLNRSGLGAANFLDFGGDADAARLKAAFALIFGQPSVKALFLNLYGGILSCADVAAALARVLGGAAPPRPIVARLAGNGAVEGRAILAGLCRPDIHLARDMDQAMTLLRAIVEPTPSDPAETAGAPATSGPAGAFGPAETSASTMSPGASASTRPSGPDEHDGPAVSSRPSVTSGTSGGSVSIDRPGIRVAPAVSGPPPRPVLAPPHSLLDLGPDSGVLVQGLTGRTASRHARLMRAYGTRIVCGVTPFRGGTKVDGPPVYDTVAEALRHHHIALSLVFAPPPFAADAALEAVEAGVPRVVVITEGVPQKDMLTVRARLDPSRTLLLGPNTPGLLLPGRFKAGIMPAEPFSPGPVAVFSRSGTLTYEAAARLTAKGIGQALVAGIGGDPFVGAGFPELCAMVADDPRVAAVLVIGEIGGRQEEDLAEFVAGRGYPKPVAAFLGGLTAPPGRRLGHAGAILERPDGAALKTAALARAGVAVCPDLSDIAPTMARLLGRV